jgi:hypothetical protein
LGGPFRRGGSLYPPQPLSRGQRNRPLPDSYNRFDLCDGLSPPAAATTTRLLSRPMSHRRSVARGLFMSSRSRWSSWDDGFVAAVDPIAVTDRIVVRLGLNEADRFCDMHRRREAARRIGGRPMTDRDESVALIKRNIRQVRRGLWVWCLGGDRAIPRASRRGRCCSNRCSTVRGDRDRMPPASRQLGAGAGYRGPPRAAGLAIRGRLSQAGHVATRRDHQLVSPTQPHVLDRDPPRSTADAERRRARTGPTIACRSSGWVARASR